MATLVLKGVSPMKRILSFLLAALLMASSIVSCGNNGSTIKETEASDTKAVETKAPETGTPATDAPETTAPAPSYDTSLLVENGVAKAHIVLPDGASDFEKTAAEELAYHIKLVTGAEIAVTNAAQSDSSPSLSPPPTASPNWKSCSPRTWLGSVCLRKSPMKRASSVVTAMTALPSVHMRAKFTSLEPRHVVQ